MNIRVCAFVCFERFSIFNNVRIWIRILQKSCCLFFWPRTYEENEKQKRLVFFWIHAVMKMYFFEYKYQLHNNNNGSVWTFICFCYLKFLMNCTNCCCFFSIFSAILTNLFRFIFSAKDFGNIRHHQHQIFKYRKIHWFWI